MKYDLEVEEASASGSTPSAAVFARSVIDAEIYVIGAEIYVIGAEIYVIDAGIYVIDAEISVMDTREAVRDTNLPRCMSRTRRVPVQGDEGRDTPSTPTARSLTQALRRPCAVCYALSGEAPASSSSTPL